MNVNLLQSTKNTVKFLTDIASICYGHEEAKNPIAMMKNLNKLGHHSIFEHAFYTFKIERISRTCLAQLTRHRHASYTVRSQRYCDESDFKAIIPKEIWEDKELLKKWQENMFYVNQTYKYLIENGIKREDARSVLPGAIITDLYMTLNLRELLHIFKLRVDDSAQDEISDLVNEMITLVLEDEPELTILFYKKY